MKSISALGFKALARRDRKAAGELMVRKLAVLQPLAGEDGSVRFCITTGTVDREGDTIAVGGWDTDPYMANPVVLWGHDASEPPVGRAVQLIRDSGSIKADVQFVPADVPIYGPRAEGIRQLCTAGFLFATSVGFRPLEWSFTEDEARGAGDWFPGIDFKRQELMEVSIVSVPANPDALIEPPAALLDALNPPAVDPPVVEAAAAAARAKRLRQQRRQIARLFA